MGRKVSIDFAGVGRSWKDEPPTERQIDIAYEHVPRHVVDRWLQEGRTRGFFSMVIDYIFENKIHPDEALYIDWDEIANWYEEVE